MPKTQYIQQKEKSQPLFMKRGDILSEFFEISDKAREGGMGDVFFCRDKRDNKFYVLKTFQEIKEGKDNNLRNFDKEAMASLQIPRLPYVVYTKTLIADGTRQYLVMDFVGKQPRSLEEPVQGETLARVLKSTKIEYKQALIWAIEFCRGMQNLHKHGIAVHKDIKLDNILLAPDNSICITDFGLSVLNKKGGTKGYFPPEYGKSSELTEQSDIYSFGIVLYQLFFNTCSVTINQELVDKNILLKQCLKNNPKERYQHFSDLEKDLKKELKQKFPEYKLQNMPRLTMTADDYFGKGLGLYVLTLGLRQDKELHPLPLAEKLLGKSIKLNPYHAAAYYYRARVISEEHPFAGYYVSMKDKRFIPDSSEKRAIQRIQSDEKYAQQYSALYANLIELEHYAKQHEDPYIQPNDDIFLKTYIKHSRRHPRDPYLHNNLGVFEEYTKHYNEAINHLTKAIKLLPNYAIAYANRASVYLLLNQEKKALKDCAKYTQLRQGNKSFIPPTLFYGIYVRIFRRYCWNKEYKKAYAWYEKHLDLFPKLNPEQRRKMLNRVRFQIQYHRLTHLSSKYDKKEILKEYRELWKLYKQIQQEKIEIKKEDWFSAEEKQSLQISNCGFPTKPNMRPIFFRRICIEHPSAPILNEMGYYVAGWGRNDIPEEGVSGAHFPEKAIPYFDRAIEADRTYAPAYYNRARAYQECNEYAKAISDYTTALKLAPEQAYSDSTRCEYYMDRICNLIDGNDGSFRDGQRWIDMMESGDILSMRIKEQYSSHYIGAHLIVDKEVDIEYPHKPHIYKLILNKAKFYFRATRYEKALYYLQKLGRFEDAPKLYVQKGTCFYKLGQYQEALKCFLNINTDKEDRKTIMCSNANIALCHAKLGNTEQEKVHLNKAFNDFFITMGLAQDPNLREGIVKATGRRVLMEKTDKGYVRVNLDKKFYQQVSSYFESCYKQCLVKNKLFNIVMPVDMVDMIFLDNAYYQRAECYFALKNYAAALADYTKILQSYYPFPSAFIPKFVLHVEEKITTCEKALKIAPTKKS
ncbi:MAG: tetratricopeptide repeat protein [Elusimicrobiaceae bacterium]|nr:tetratricopeptide repeat protein [Elusimicrobiaceae bacterium]